jgi:carboxypeptidase D
MSKDAIDKLTDVFRVDQPVGVGFSNGTPTATSEEDIAADFIQFFEEFQESYDIKNFRIFLTGESYAGRYVPYISAAMLDKNDTEHFNLSGKTRTCIILVPNSHPY